MAIAASFVHVHSTPGHGCTTRVGLAYFDGEWSFEKTEEQLSQDSQAVLRNLFPSIDSGFFDAEILHSCDAERWQNSSVEIVNHRTHSLKVVQLDDQQQHVELEMGSSVAVEILESVDLEAEMEEAVLTHSTHDFSFAD